MGIKKVCLSALIKKNRVKKLNNKDGTSIAIIPCYNEEATVGSIVLKVKRHVNKVLVIDDGSSDDTAKIAKSAGAVVISHDKNYGKSYAIKTGFRYALDKNYDFVITIDGDGQHNADEIPIVLGDLKNNGHDITLGFRTGNNTEMPGWRKIGKRLLDYATSFGNGGFVTDSQCGFRAFNKKAVNGLATRLNGDAFCVESEQLIRAHDLGLKLNQVDVTCKYNNLKNTSKKNSVTHGFSVLRYIIGLVAEKHPLLLIGVPGLILFLIGLSFGIMTLQHFNSEHAIIIPYALIGSIFIIIGVFTLLMGLVLTALPNIIRRVNTESE